MQQNSAVAKVIFVPQREDAACVSLAGNDDHGIVSVPFEAGVNCVEFVRSIDDRSVQHTDRFRGDTGIEKNFEVAGIFAGERGG